METPVRSPAGIAIKLRLWAKIMCLTDREALGLDNGLPIAALQDAERLAGEAPS